MKYDFLKELSDHTKLISVIEADKELLQKVSKSIGLICKALKSGKKILFCGNGGSAADAEHLAAELSGRFLKNRAPLNAEALHVNSAALTAISNDFGYDKVYERILEAKGKKGDILVVISTSGKSENILKVMKQASKMNIKLIAITGKTNLKAYEKTDIHLSIPSKNTPRTQEAMMLLGHIICGEVERKLFP